MAFTSLQLEAILKSVCGRKCHKMTSALRILCDVVDSKAGAHDFTFATMDDEAHLGPTLF